ncbi:MAG: GH92 family glycosyl hydrolase [Planctomycetota bacterium]|nr:GH92 family glycosyl hydrolase [Planctomycetota bacterium]
MLKIAQPRFLLASPIFGLVACLGLIPAWAGDKGVNGDKSSNLVKKELKQGSRRLPSMEVNPFIGTGGHGHTFPGATRPFGMVQLSPDTRLTGWDGCSGYHDSDRVIYGFSHTHLSGTGVSDYGEILLMPGTGPKRFNNGAKTEPAQGYASRFRKKTERGRPAYYSVFLDDYQINVELTATKRAGFHRYTFPKSEDSHIVLDLNHRDRVLETTLHIRDSKTITGLRRSSAWARDQRLYFAARFSKAFESVALDSGDAWDAGKGLCSKTARKAILSFRTKNRERILVKVGLSAVSAENALENLDDEIKDWGFDRVYREGRRAWDKELGKIELEGGSRKTRRIFYTALYHSLIAPNLFSDRNKQYRGLDGSVHELKGGDQYTVFSLWDTFRATHPLFTLIQQEKTLDFIRAFLRHYKEGGALPVWELSGNETQCMIGYHSVSVIADAALKGLSGFDEEPALEAMLASAESDRFGLKSYRKKGFIDSADEAESVSKTLEYAYDDWCIGQYAKKLGKTDIAKRYLRRGQYYKNLFDPASGFFRSKDNGRWVPGFDPREVNFHYTEANAWQYSLFVPQDIQGLLTLKGGREKLRRHLDRLFEDESKTTGRDQVDITGLIGQYAHGNEPSHHMAYLYNYVEKGSEAQKRVWQILNQLYSDKPDGLSGNEDCGQMSSWYVLSALGIYQVTPGQPIYVFGTPLFDKATLNLENGKRFVFRARNKSAKNIYIQGLVLNGKPYHKAFIQHKTIMAGGELIYEMGAEPNDAWVNEWPSSKIDEPFTAVPFFQSKSQTFQDELMVSLSSPEKNVAVYFTLDGTVPTLKSERYSQPLILKETTVVKALAVSSVGVESLVVEGEFYKVRGDRSIVLHAEYANQYAAGGKGALIDSLRGGANFRTGRWQGYRGDFGATVDLGEAQTIKEISMGFLQDIQSWIWLPKSVELFVSEDGRSFKRVATLSSEIPDNRYGAVRWDVSAALNNVKARYIKVKAKNFGRCPDWHLGAGGRAWLFIDEIEID